MTRSDRETVIRALSHARMRPYLQRCDGSVKDALKLYQWHSELTASVQTVLGTTEVILRNAIDAQLQEWNRANQAGSQSWLLTTPAAPLRRLTEVKRREAVRRAQKQASERPTEHWRHSQPVSHDDVLAHVMFGMWKDLMPNHQPGANPAKQTNKNRVRLWEESLHKAFPYIDDSGGSITFWRIAHLHRLRNRISHMEPLLDVDVKSHVNEAFQLIRSIDPIVEQWLSGMSRVNSVLKRMPYTRKA